MLQIISTMDDENSILHSLSNGSLDKPEVVIHFIKHVVGITNCKLYEQYLNVNEIVIVGQKR